MALTPDQSQVVREHLAKCLQIDPSQVTRLANFFQELGGTNEQLRMFQSNIELALGIAIDPIVVDINSLTEINESGNVTLAAIIAIRNYLPGDIGLSLNEAPFPSLLSVEMIEAIVEKALRERITPEVQSFKPLSAEYSARLHGMIRQHMRVPFGELMPETNLIQDLRFGGTQMATLFREVKEEFDFEMLPLYKSLEARLRMDAEGNVTSESRKHLEPLLSGIDFPTSHLQSVNDLLTIGFVEALIARRLAQRPADWPLQSISSRRQQAWVTQLPQQLGDRKLRLLLAGACRLAFRHTRNPEPEVFLALEALEKFADTGKTKSELQRFQKAFPDWGHWRNQLQYRGVFQSLSTKEPERAVATVTGAILEACQLNEFEALRELQRLYHDLISEFADSERFAASWRTTAVVDLAASMYNARDFNKMPELAELLEHAGCSDLAVLDHCRDSKKLHIRGCWLIDAILNGRWADEPKISKRKEAKPEKSAGTNSAKSKPTLLSLLPKRTQLDIAKTMAEETSQVSVESYLAKYFRATHDDLIRIFDVSDPETSAKQLDDELIELEMRRPELTTEQQLLKLGVRWIIRDHDVAVSRRVMIEDPAELARGLFVANRLDWLHSGCQSQSCDSLLSLFAVRDLALVEYLAQHSTDSNTQFPNDEHTLCSSVMAALIQRDFAALQPIVERMKRKKVRSWMEQKFTCLLGIADRQAGQIVQGLHGMLDSYPKRKDDDSSSIFSVFNVEVHGLYRLSEWISPDLVTGFDVTAGWPWDAEFHAWTEAHKNPLEGIDFSCVAPLLSDAVLRLKVPEWWIQSAAAAAARDLELRSACDVWLLDFGPNPEPVTDLITRYCGKPPTTCPVKFFSKALRYMAEGWRRQLQKAGAKVELRPFVA